MDERDEEAMERGLQASKAVVCILSKSYFQRPFCVKELSWACKYDKPVIICVPSELKGFIGEFGGQPPKGAGTAMVVAAPGFLRGLIKIDIMTLDRSDNKYWQVGVDKVRGAARKTIQPILKPGATINSATEEALIALSAHPAAGDDDTDDGLANGQRPDAVYATSARKDLTFATERGFYSRLFKYNMDKVTADRAFEVLVMSSTTLEDKVEALRWLGFQLQTGGVAKGDFDWVCDERGHFFELLNPLMSDGLGVDEASLQRAELAMNLLHNLCVSSSGAATVEQAQKNRQLAADASNPSTLVKIARTAGKNSALQQQSLRALSAIARKSKFISDSLYDTWIFELGEQPIEGCNVPIHTGLLEIFESCVDDCVNGDVEEKLEQRHKDSVRSKVTSILGLLATNNEMCSILISAGAVDMACRLLKACKLETGVVVDETAHLLCGLLDSASIQDKTAAVEKGVCSALVEAIASETLDSSVTPFLLRALVVVLQSVTAAVRIVDGFEHSQNIIKRCIRSGEADICRFTAHLAFTLGSKKAFRSLMYTEDHGLPVVKAMIETMNNPDCHTQAKLFLFRSIVTLAKVNENALVRAMLTDGMLQRLMPSFDEQYKQMLQQNVHEIEGLKKRDKESNDARDTATFATVPAPSPPPPMPTHPPFSPPLQHVISRKHGQPRR
uniref:TIR domain-containing protein n=1 Tax=Mantoniella antarctica TaxID=81844 RepID=A0A7S0SK12_9CHLO